MARIPGGHAPPAGRDPVDIVLNPRRAEPHELGQVLARTRVGGFDAWVKIATPARGAMEHRRRVEKAGLPEDGR